MGDEEDEHEYRVSVTAQINGDISTVIVGDTTKEVIEELNLFIKEYEKK